MGSKVGALKVFKQGLHVIRAVLLALVVGRVEWVEEPDGRQNGCMDPDNFPSRQHGGTNVRDDSEELAWIWGGTGKETYILTLKLDEISKCFEHFYLAGPSDYEPTVLCLLRLSIS